MPFGLPYIAFSTVNFSSETENAFVALCSLSPYNPYPIKHNVLNLPGEKVKRTMSIGEKVAVANGGKKKHLSVDAIDSMDTVSNL